MKRSLICGALVLIVLCSYAGADTKKKSDTPKIVSPDLTSIADGTYTGSHKAGLVSATVELTVKNHTITDFAIKKHRCGEGRPAEAVAGKVLEQQTLEVDTISGATASSNVILKAAEKALTNTK